MSAEQTNQPTVAILNTEVCNLTSVYNAFSKLRVQSEVVENGPELLQLVERTNCGVVIPGVGSFGDGMNALRASGFVEPLRELASSNVPILGICLGMQLLVNASDESPGAEGLGIIGGTCKKLPSNTERVPHIGWAETELKESPLHAGMEESVTFYFVHSYAVQADRDCEIGSFSHEGEMTTASIGSGNVFGVQFHPEKSQDSGLCLLRNFVDHYS